MKKDPKDKAAAFLAEFVDAVTDKFGKGTVARLSDPGAYEEVEYVVSTGVPALDAAIGVGGLPGKKLIEIFGPESVGKTSLTKGLAAKAQEQGYVPVLLDTEQSGALEYDKAIGLNPDKAAAGQPDTCEKVMGVAAQALELAIKRKQRILVMWDSLAATPMAGELDAEFDAMMKSAPAERARYMGKSLPRIVNLAAQADSIVVIVNQLREKVGAMPFEKPTYSPGGRALRHWAHVRLELSSRGKILEKGQAIGIKTMVKVVKNKVAPPYRDALLEIRFAPQFSITEGKAEKVTRTPV